MVTNAVGLSANIQTTATKQINISQEPAQQAPEETVVAHPKVGASAHVLEEWPEILQILGGYSKAIATAFTGTNAFVSGDYVLIDAPSDSMAFELLRKSSQREQMREAIRASYRQGVQVRALQKKRGYSYSKLRPVKTACGTSGTSGN